MGFSLPKQFLKSQPILKDASRFLGWFWKQTNPVLQPIYRYVLMDICVSSEDIWCHSSLKLDIWCHSSLKLGKKTCLVALQLNHYSVCQPEGGLMFVRIIRTKLVTMYYY